MTARTASRAAHLIRLLARVEHAHATDQLGETTRLLEGVDPAECATLAGTLEGIANEGDVLRIGCYPESLRA